MLAEEWSGDDSVKPNRGTTNGPECRSELRTITLFKTAAILSRGHAGLCVIKNMSSGGAMIKTALPLSTGEPAEIALASGVKVEGVVRWQRDGLHGIQFETPIDVAKILSNGADTPSARNARRSPRLVMNVPIRVESSTNIVSAMTHNISTHGMRMICESRIGKGQAIIWLPNIPSKSVRILWSEHGQAGCAFDQPFQIDELTNWAVKAMANIDPTEPNHEL